MPKGGFEPLEHHKRSQHHPTQPQHLSTVTQPAPIRRTPVKHPPNVVSHPARASRVQFHVENGPDENLSKVVAAWPDLRPEDQQRIMAIVERGDVS